ncbi:hypothetical protein F5887DRAFT_982590 [Amanita rubescens]|nr:hypothetical protein F5887DRAFT_982590 [Amanita rubescens]
MEKDIKEMLARHQTDIEDLAAKHGRKPDYIKKIVTNQTCYKSTRNVSLHNAIIHHKNVEINAGRALGERVPLNEIQKMAKTDPELQNLSEEKKRELLDALEEHRKVNEHGLRTSNLSASLDMKSTMDQIGSEMDKLCGRTGVRAFAFISKGHLTDVSAPGWLGSGDALAFFPAVMKMSVEDFSAKFEHWSVTQNRRPPPPDSLKAVRAECTALIIKGLSTITGRPTIKMNYLNYETSIVAVYHVKLVGWPTNVPFGNPSNIGDVSSVRALRRALQDGECKWMKLTELQQREHEEMLEERRRTGQVVGVKRKKRSDKGGTHQKSGKRHRLAPNDNDEQEEEAEEPPAESRTPRPRRRAAAQIPPSFKSRQYVNDNDGSPYGSGDEENYEDGEDNDNVDSE